MTPFDSRRIVCCLALPWLIGCSSSNHAFRNGIPKNTVSVLALSPAPASAAKAQPLILKPRDPCPKQLVHVGSKEYSDAVATVGQPCIGFLEFDDMGEPFDREVNHEGVGPNRWGIPHQLVAAIDLIKDTRTYALNTHAPAPIIVVFVHGWKHNASENDENVQGFEQVIRFIAGQKVDSLTENACADSESTKIFPLRCDYAKHPIIGIYIGWRGDLFNKYLPIAQDLSYFDREAAGERTGADNVTHALMSISTAAGHGADAKPNAPDTPFLLFIGHSFGGLVLERAVSQSLLSELDRHSSVENTFQPFADLIVYVNTAAAATFSKPVVDILAQNRAVYEPTSSLSNPDDQSRNELNASPLILSVSTPADAATSIILPIGQTIGSFPKHLTRSFRQDDPLACYDPYRSGTIPQQSNNLSFKQSLFYTHSAPHLEQLQSHDIVELVDAKKHPLEACPTTLPAGVLKTFDSVPGRCFALVDHDKRCNGTPYWILQTDKSIIPDHGTIFTGRFISFLTGFFPQVPSRLSPVGISPELMAIPVSDRTQLRVQPPAERPQDRTVISNQPPPPPERE